MKKINKFPHAFQCLPEITFLFTTEWPELPFYIYRWTKALQVIKRPLHNFRCWSLKQNGKKSGIVFSLIQLSKYIFQSDAEQNFFLICSRGIEITDPWHSPSQTLLDYSVFILHWAFSWGMLRKYSPGQSNFFSLKWKKKCTPWESFHLDKLFQILYTRVWRCPFPLQCTHSLC